MARRQQSPTSSEDVLGVLTDILITQLAVAGVPQLVVRKIVGCDIHRVSRIAKHVNAARKAVPSRRPA